MTERCKDLVIECEDCKDTKLCAYVNSFLFFNSSTIHVCANNIGRPGALTDVLLHELAHTCGWDHGDGKGVPGDDGKLRC